MRGTPLGLQTAYPELSGGISRNRFSYSDLSAKGIVKSIPMDKKIHKFESILVERGD
jgi:hypothetical protein